MCLSRSNASGIGKRKKTKLETITYHHNNEG